MTNIWKHIFYRFMSYSHDFEPFERHWMARNMYYTYDFETNKNLPHKQSVLFYGYLRSVTLQEFNWIRATQNGFVPTVRYSRSFLFPKMSFNTNVLGSASDWQDSSLPHFDWLRALFNINLKTYLSSIAFFSLSSLKEIENVQSVSVADTVFGNT